jgi:hypothetical protein
LDALQKHADIGRGLSLLGINFKHFSLPKKTGMNKKVSEVRVTTEYSMFKFDPLNRSVKPNKLTKLKQSISRTNGNLQAVLIDQKGNIIDGQHRFVACKLLGLPVKYTIADSGYKTSDMLELNNNGSGWVATDFAEYHAKQGNPNYEIFLKYKKQFPELKDGILCSILENRYTLKDTTTGSMSKRGFQEGTFIVMQENKAKTLLNHLREISSFYQGWNRRAFIYALIHLSNCKDFNWDKFISKLQIRHVSLFDYPKAEDFVKVLGDVYNYRERKKLTMAL